MEGKNRKSFRTILDDLFGVPQERAFMDSMIEIQKKTKFKFDRIVSFRVLFSKITIDFSINKLIFKKIIILRKLSY